MKIKTSNAKIDPIIVDVWSVDELVGCAFPLVVELFWSFVGIFVPGNDIGVVDGFNITGTEGGNKLSFKKRFVEDCNDG